MCILWRYFGEGLGMVDKINKAFAKLWSEIAEFESGEQKLQLKPLQWEARMSARMAAYDNLIEWFFL